MSAARTTWCKGDGPWQPRVGLRVLLVPKPAIAVATEVELPTRVALDGLT
jgi:hypothetical protein